MSGNLWLAKLGAGNSLAPESWNKEILGVGWKISNKQLEELHKIREDPKLAYNYIKEIMKDSQITAEMFRFIIEAKNDDFVLVGPVYWIDKDEEEETKCYLIGKIVSEAYIPTEDLDDKEYRGGFNLVRKMKWKEFDLEISKGLKDYMGRTRRTFVSAQNSPHSYSMIEKIFLGETIDEYGHINGNYDGLNNSIIDYLSSMDAFDFEEYIHNLLMENSWEIYPTPKSGDKGVDLYGSAPILGNFSVDVVIQVKSYKKPISKNLVENFQNEEIPYHYNLHNPLRVFITTSTFTKPAKEQARDTTKTPIILMDGSNLVDLCIFSEMIPGVHWIKEEIK